MRLDGRSERFVRRCRKEGGRKLQPRCGMGWLPPRSWMATGLLGISSQHCSFQGPSDAGAPACLFLRAAECLPGALGQPPIRLHWPELCQVPAPEANTAKRNRIATTALDSLRSWGGVVSADGQMRLGSTNGHGRAHSVCYLLQVQKTGRSSMLDSNNGQYFLCVCF